MPPDGQLVGRVREALAARGPVREVPMFGGLSFMVDDRMVVCARDGGDLLVRADPARADELLAVDGARPAEMGAGRSMGPSWISVGREAVASDEDLGWWLAVALAHHAAQAGAPPRRRRRAGS